LLNKVEKNLAIRKEIGDKNGIADTIFNLGTIAIHQGDYEQAKKYLEENIKDIKRNPVTGEYYITDIIDIISHHQGKIAAYKLADKKWQGVNTREDLIEAERILSNE
jgi:bifunctional N-acetylglucosamine-1-phosphate-uridyltransferase/glucosamine-1-phosphate-acetyltransferase GlmU-like protein